MGSKNRKPLVEDLMIDCLNKDTSGYAKYTGFKIDKHISRDTCKAIVIGTTFLDFKSVGHLKQMSKQILVQECNPFTKITTSYGKKIDEFFIIRNYLAHYSDAARRSLLSVYKDGYGMKRFVEPGVFLLAKDREEEMPRMGVYINNFKNTANAMGKFLGIY